MNNLTWISDSAFNADIVSLINVCIIIIIIISLIYLIKASSISVHLALTSPGTRNAYRPNNRMRIDQNIYLIFFFKFLIAIFVNMQHNYGSAIMAL